MFGEVWSHGGKLMYVKDPFVVQGAGIGCENPGHHTDEGGVAELEEILKQKTFTRSEIDRLTCLLCSRTVDNPGGNEEERSKVKPVVSCDKNENFPSTPVRENGTKNHLISTPLVSSTVLDEHVASPAELAKAYMGSRPSKVSVSMLGLHNEMPREDSALLSNEVFSSKSPIMSLVPTSSGNVGSLGNGFVTSRYRGRSAIYSIARSPYSRINSAAVLKGASTTSDGFGRPSSSSSSQSALEQNRISGTRQGVLKRRSSVLDNDIGSISHIRRIRQKSNVLPSKNLSLPSSTGPLSIQVAGTSAAGLDTLTENGDNCTPGTSFTPVRSKSSEMASKILRQLDKLVYPREKSPTKLSPSMLRGQALKSLENVDYSKFLENMHDSDKLSGSHTALPDIWDSKSHKCDKVKENGSTTVVAHCDKSVPAVNGADTGSLMKDNNEPIVKAADSTLIKSVVQLTQQKRRAFQMSAHEDSLDPDDDDYPNGAASATFGEGRERLDYCVMGSKTAAAEAKLVDKPSGLSEVKSIPSFSFNQKPDSRTSDGSAVIENNAGITFPIAQVANSSVPAALLVSQSTSTTSKDAASEEPKATSPMLSFGENVAPAPQSDAAASTLHLTSTNVGEVSSASGSSGVKLATSSDQKLDNSSSFATTAPGKTDYLSDKSDKENTLNGIFRTADTATSCAVSNSTSAGSIFKFGGSKNSPALTNGSLASSPFSFSLPAPSLMPNNVESLSSSSTNFISFTASSDTFAAATTSTTANVTVGSASSPSMDASVSSFTAAPVFKFASSGDPSASVLTLSATSGEATEAKTKDTSSVNVAIVPFGSTSAFTSSGSNIFGGTPAVAGTVSSASGCITAVVTSSGNSSFSGTSSSITNCGNGFNSTFSTVTNTGNGIFGGTSATSEKDSSVFGGASLSIASTGSIISTTPAIKSTGSNIFGFSAPAASLSTAQTQGLNPFNAVNTQACAAGTGIGPSTESMPTRFSSSASSPSFGLAGSTASSSGNNSVCESSSVANPFGAGATFGITSSSETNSISCSSGIALGSFGSTWQASKMPIFGSSSSSSSSSGFSFGSSASFTVSSSTPTIIGSSTGASSSSSFSFTSAAATTPSQPMFGNSSSGLVFGSTPSSNNDQMEDSMAEDTVQASPPTVPTFGQKPIPLPASGFVFGASNASGASSFQFGAQPSMATPQNPSPFQASGSVEFGAGGSFSLGSGGGDKSARKFVKVRKQRKK